MPSFEADQRGTFANASSKRESLASAGTLGSFGVIFNAEELNDEDLQSAVVTMEKELRILRLEIEMMIRYLVRNAQFDEGPLRESLDRYGDRILEVEQYRMNKRFSLLGEVKGAAGTQLTAESSTPGEPRSGSNTTVASDANEEDEEEHDEGAVPKQKGEEETGETDTTKESSGNENPETGEAETENNPEEDSKEEEEDEKGSEDEGEEEPQEGDEESKEGGEEAEEGGEGTKEDGEKPEEEGTQKQDEKQEEAAGEEAEGEAAAEGETAAAEAAGETESREAEEPKISTETSSQHFSTTSSMLTSPSGLLAFERRGPRLNVPGKAEMLARELRDGQRDLDVFEALLAKKKLKLCELLEASASTSDELQRETQNFHQDVTVGGIDPVTGRIPAERFTRHVSEWTRVTTLLCDKLRLRSTTLRVNIRKVRVQLKTKQELGESLRPVDFEQLRIDNERFLQIIEQKNLQVIELKRMAGDCALQLSVHKKALLSDRSIEEYLRGLGDERRKQCDVMEYESSLVEEQNERLHNRLESLRSLTQNFTAPPVLDYARICAKVAEQEREMHMWKRRVGLQETALRVACSNLRTTRFHMRHSTGVDMFQPGRPSSDVDDVNSQAFQNFWFGDGASSPSAPSRPNSRAVEVKDSKGSVGLEEEDSWTDIPDTFLVDKSPLKTRIVPSPCTPPTPETEEAEKGKQAPANKRKK